MILFRCLLIAYSAILFLAYVVLGVKADLTPVSYLYILMANIYMVLCSRRNFLLFILAFIVFFCNYSIIFANFTDKIDDIYTIPLSSESFMSSINILTLFNLFLFICVKWDKILLGFENNVFVNSREKDSIILYVLYALLIPIFFLGFTNPEVEGQRGNQSAAYEYSAILFMLFFYYSGNQKWHLRAGVLLVCAFSLQSFVFGGRIEGIQFILVTYVMLFMHRISMPKVMIAMGVMFFLMSVVGVVRGELLYGNVDFLSIVTSLVNGGFSLDTAYSAYYTSESFVYVLDKFTIQEILIFGGEFLKSIFVGANPDMLLTSISNEYVQHYGGGLTPFYFYFYLGVFGVLIAACLVAFYINIVINLKEQSSGYLKCLSVWIVSTTFRWYLYTPIGLLRGVLLLTIAYYAFAYLHYQLNRLPCWQKNK